MHLAPGKTQALKCLGTGHLMNEVAINVEKTRSVFVPANNVIIPNFVEQRLWRGHLIHASFIKVSGSTKAVHPTPSRTCPRLIEDTTETSKQAHGYLFFACTIILDRAMGNFFGNARTLAGTASKVIELGTTNRTATLYLNTDNIGGKQGERSFHAFAV